MMSRSISKNKILALVLGVTVGGATVANANQKAHLDADTAAQLLNGIMQTYTNSGASNFLIKEVLDNVILVEELQPGQIQQIEQEIEFLKEKINNQKASVVMSSAE